jgi:hypothetical protein
MFVTETSAGVRGMDLVSPDARIMAGHHGAWEERERRGEVRERAAERREEKRRVEKLGEKRGERREEKREVERGQKRR